MPDASPEAANFADRVRRVQDHIANAAIRAGRRPDDITLIAVSKTVPAATIAMAAQAGLTRFGENRVQEAAGKFTALRAAHPALRLHLIGGLQTNKAGDAVAVADMIESLDRPKLAEALAREIGRQARAPHLLVQVNVGDEPQKSGIGRQDADAFIGQCRDRFGAALCGLMCVPPMGIDPAPHFAWLADRAARHGLPIVSMGMSGDFETAIMHGATQVRVGSALFGAR